MPNIRQGHYNAHLEAIAANDKEKLLEGLAIEANTHLRQIQIYGGNWETRKCPSTEIAKYEDIFIQLTEDGKIKSTYEGTPHKIKRDISFYGMKLIHHAAAKNVTMLGLLLSYSHVDDVNSQVWQEDKSELLLKTPLHFAIDSSKHLNGFGQAKASIIKLVKAGANIEAFGGKDAFVEYAEKIAAPVEMISYLRNNLQDLITNNLANRRNVIEKLPKPKQTTIMQAFAFQQKKHTDSVELASLEQKEAQAPKSDQQIAPRKFAKAKRNAKMPSVSGPMDAFLSKEHSLLARSDSSGYSSLGSQSSNESEELDRELHPKKVKIESKENDFNSYSMESENLSVLQALGIPNSPTKTRVKKFLTEQSAWQRKILQERQDHEYAASLAKGHRI